MTSFAPAEMAPKNWLRERARADSNAPALFCASGTMLLDFAGLSEEVDRLSAEFVKCGIGRDARVLVCLKDGPEALIVLMSLMSVTTVVPVHVTASADHIERLIKQLGVSVFVGENRPASAAWKIAEAQNLSYFSVENGPAQFVPLQLVRHKTIPQPPSEPAGLDDIALCISTSGTTGSASIVMITQRSLDLNVSTHGLLNGYGPETRALSVMSFAYLFAYVRSSLPILRFGGAVAVAPGYRFADVRRCCEVFKPNSMAATPAILQKLLADAEAQEWKPEAGVFRRFHATGEAIPDTLHTRLAAAFGASLGTNYGMTEVSPQVANRRPEDTFAPNAVGSIVSPWIVEAVDEEGKVLPQGRIGRLTLRGGRVNAVFGVAKEVRFDAEGRFFTGDRGYVDEAGVLYIVGRVDDIINRGGEKLDPKEIERAFENDPDVERAVVFGVADPKMGQRIYGLLVLRKGADRCIDQIRASVGERIAGWGQPERLFEVSAIPTNTNGKVSRSDLARRYRDE